jgi:hypothetical protein
MINKEKAISILKDAGAHVDKVKEDEWYVTQNPSDPKDEPISMGPFPTEGMAIKEGIMWILGVISNTQALAISLERFGSNAFVEVDTFFNYKGGDPHPEHLKHKIRKGHEVIGSGREWNEALEKADQWLKNALKAREVENAKEVEKAKAEKKAKEPKASEADPKAKGDQDGKQ